MLNRLFLLIVFFLLIHITSQGQQKDFGIWKSINLNLDVHKKTNIAISQEFRLFENATELGNHISEISIKQTVFNNFRIDLTYRLANKKQVDNSFFIAHRLAFDLRYKVPIINNFSLKLRTRYQGNLRKLQDDFQRSPINQAWRNKIGLAYKINKSFSAEVAAEFFNRIDRNLLLRSYRLSADIGYKPAKSHELNFGVVFQQEKNKSNPYTDFVIQTGYTYDLNVKKMIKDKRKQKAKLEKLKLKSTQ
jgi:outer membrane receptor protein involved in Fe transport